VSFFSPANDSHHFLFGSSITPLQLPVVLFHSNTHSSGGPHPAAFFESNTLSTLGFPSISIQWPLIAADIALTCQQPLA
jgi:hypothetical protein